MVIRCIIPVMVSISAPGIHLLSMLTIFGGEFDVRTSDAPISNIQSWIFWKVFDEY